MFSLKRTLHYLLFLLSSNDFITPSAAKNCTVPVKDAQYYKHLWLQNTAKCCEWTRPKCVPNKRVDPTCSRYGTFDFVIVGGSDAGIVLANRLSENKKVRVLLLEAGGEENEFAIIPGALPYFQASSHSWGYLSTKQYAGCLGMNGQQCALHKSKGLGSYTLFSDLYLRPHPADFTKWKSSKWTYANCLKYFKKAENMTIPELRSSQLDSAHGIYGPLWVNYSNCDWYPLFIKQALTYLGTEVLDDCNSEDLRIGISKAPVLVKEGARHTVNRAYLSPVRRARKNLVVLTRSLVTKVLISGTRAVGVNFMHGRHCKSAYAKLEVILSAGSYNTPQLLMLSGIGPKEHLKEVNINCIADLPVGKNLITRIFAELRLTSNISVSCRDFERDLFRYASTRDGLLTEFVGKIIQYKNLTEAVEGIPDIIGFYDLVYAYDDCDRGKQARNFANIVDKYLRDMKNYDIMIKLAHLHVKARGTVKLRSNNPLDCPVINPNILNNIDDASQLQQAVTQLLVALVKIATLNINVTQSFIPQCDQFKNCSALYVQCLNSYIAHPSSDAYGTCKMGRGGDSVVNEELLVHGFPNLRVVCDCVIPSTLSSFTPVTEVMIAEKIVDDIKARHRLLIF